MNKLKALTTLDDERLAPYFITKDDYCWTVNERVTPNQNHFRAKKSSKIYNKPRAYFPNLGQALNWISQNQLHDKGESTMDDVLKKFKTIETNIKSYTNELRSTI
jgi:hypothetical protein|tara:strand:- start:210 stop:524 length:315 start_codon:yes stop_codon:yes gene_type:complete